MIELGYVKLHRSILKWEWYDDPNTMRLFLHLLLTVNYEPKKWHGITIERGQRVCSIAVLAKETRLSQRSIRTCIERLISTGEVTKLSNPQYTVVTIKNYDKYQTATNEVTNERQATDKPPTNDRQQCKKDKESNKKVKEIYPSDIEYANPQDVADAFNRICISLPKVSKLTDARQRQIRLKKSLLEDFEQVFLEAEQSDFLSGRTGKWNGCCFDWLMNAANWQKVKEGNYRNKTETRTDKLSNLKRQLQEAQNDT